MTLCNETWLGEQINFVSIFVFHNLHRNITEMRGSRNFSSGGGGADFQKLFESLVDFFYFLGRPNWFSERSQFTKKTLI